MPTALVLRSCFLSLLALAPAAQGVKLNGPLATGARGSVQSYPSFSPDGKWVVYQVDDDADFQFELYSRRVDGKTPGIKLRGETGTYESTFVVGNTHVVFEAEEGLFSVPLDGSGPAVRLAPSFPEGTRVLSLRIVEERGRVLYAAYGSGAPDFLLELFSVPLDGSESPVRLGGSLSISNELLQPQLSADRSQVVFAATTDDPERIDLFVAPIDGSQPARALDLPLVSGGDVAFLAVTAADLVVYTADQEEDERYELFVLPLDGSQAPRKLNGPLAPGGDVGEYRYFPAHGYTLYSFARLSPDGLFAAYTADEDGDWLPELHGVRLDGSGGPVALSMPAQGDVYPTQFTPDSARVLYVTEGRVASASELFSVRADGSEAPRKLNGALVPGRTVLAPQVSLDGQRVVYLADQDQYRKFEIFAAPVEGGATPIQLNLPLPDWGEVFNDSNPIPGYRIVGGDVVYEADAERDGVFDLYRVPLGGGASVKIAAGPVSDLIPAPPGTSFPRVFFRRERSELFTLTTQPGSVPVDVHPLPVQTVGAVSAFELAANGARVTFTASTHARDSLELFSSATDERHARVELAPGPVFYGPLPSPDESRMIFVALKDNSSHLFSAPSDGASAPLDLGLVGSASLPADPGLVVTPDGASVLFLGGEPFAPPALLRVPLDGSAQPLDLGAALPAGSTPRTPLRLSADGSRVAFLLMNSPVLWVAPIDGLGPAVPVSLGRQGVQNDFELAPDGSALVYRGSVALGRTDLFWATSDGSSAPRRLNPTLPVNGGVEGFAVDWAAGRAVYLADQQVVGLFELFSVPLDGSAPAQRLHGDLVAGGDVFDFALEPGGGSVVYRADGRIDELVELFRVPVDGSRAPVRLLRRAAFVGSVSNFELTPDGTRVVFGATRPGGARELYSAPVRPPSGPPSLTPRGLVKLSRALLPGGSALDFRISADSSTVAFRAERDAQHHATLLAVPVGGEQKAVEVAGPLHDWGSVQSYQLSGDGTRIVYLADQEQAFVAELFLALTGR